MTTPQPPAPSSSPLEPVAWRVLNAAGSVVIVTQDGERGERETEYLNQHRNGTGGDPEQAPFRLDPLYSGEQITAREAEHKRRLGGMQALVRLHIGDNTKLAAQKDAWMDLVFAIGRALDCLASTFPDGNEHILRKANELSAREAERAQRIVELEGTAQAEVENVQSLRSALVRIAGTRADADIFGAHEDCWSIAAKAVDSLDERDAARSRPLPVSPQ